MGEKLVEVSREAQAFGLLGNMLTIVTSDNDICKNHLMVQITKLS